MTIKYPIEYELEPREATAGTRWLTLSLKNVGSEDLTMLDGRLSSLDEYCITVDGHGIYVSALRPGEERALTFRVFAHGTGSVRASLDGWEDGKSFHWESPPMLLTVSIMKADLVSLFAMTEPYPPIGERIKIEATIRGLAETEGLDLEFWAETPSLDFVELADITTKDLSPAEDVQYETEITPEEEGLYTIYAYLYDGSSRIGRKEEHVYVVSQ
jgi:hypothetical protein